MLLKIERGQKPGFRNLEVEGLFCLSGIDMMDMGQGCSEEMTGHCWALIIIFTSVRLDDIRTSF